MIQRGLPFECGSSTPTMGRLLVRRRISCIKVGYVRDFFVTPRKPQTDGLVIFIRRPCVEVKDRSKPVWFRRIGWNWEYG